MKQFLVLLAVSSPLSYSQASTDSQLVRSTRTVTQYETRTVQECCRRPVQECTQEPHPVQEQVCDPTEPECHDVVEFVCSLHETQADVGGAIDYVCLPVASRKCTLVPGLCQTIIVTRTEVVCYTREVQTCYPVTIQVNH